EKTGSATSSSGMISPEIMAFNDLIGSCVVSFFLDFFLKNIKILLSALCQVFICKKVLTLQFHLLKMKEEHMKVFFDQRNGDSDFHQFVSTENFSGISILIVRVRIQSAEMKSAVGAERIMEFLHDIDKTVRITYHRPHQMIVIRGRMTIKYTLDQCAADLLVVTN